MSTAEPTTELERVNPIEAMERPPLYDRLHPQQLAMVKAKCKGLDDVEVGTALQLAETMGLNIFADEFYAAKGNGGEVLIMVGRNGLLRKAEEFADYRGYDVGVVYENDEFRKGAPNPDGKSLRERAGVTHNQGHPKDRGACVGAWAVAERVGRPPRYFFAPLEDYCPENPHPKSSWARNPTVMIDKVPISVVHRTLCNISGVYLREEVEKILQRVDGADSPAISPEEEWASIVSIVRELDGSEELHNALLSAMRELNALSPGSWGLAKVQMTLPGRTEEELRRTLAQVEGDIVALSPVEEKITDAVVVEEDAEPSATAQPADAPEEPVEADPEAEEAEERIAGERAVLESRLADLEAALDEAEDEQKDELNEEITKVRDELDALS
jgi:hypothetical protein